METFLPITYLNDFVFCPYSIYLHQVFDENNEVVYSASPQQKGKSAHDHIDNVKPKNLRSVIKGAYVISNKLGVYGKLDTYYPESEKLVESKFQIKTVYRGYYYQLWAQFFSLIEMGFGVKEISLFSIKNRKSFPIKLPGKKEFEELRAHIRKIARFDFEAEMKVNQVKCQHCIYAALCDKTSNDHVYA